MTTPPKPSPEAVAAAEDIRFSLEYLKTMNVPARDIALRIEKHFAPIIAKAELCDRLASELQGLSSWYRRQMLLAPVSAQAALDAYAAAIAPSETTRAAGPADAGGGRE